MLTCNNFPTDASQDENVIILDFPFSPIESSQFLSETEITKEINKTDFEDIQPSGIQSKKIFKKRLQMIDNDIRIKVIEGYKKGKTITSLAKLFNISDNSASSIVQAFREDGTITRVEKRKYFLDDKAKAKLIYDIQNGEKYRDVGKRYNISEKTVYRIWRDFKKEGKILKQTKICSREDQSTSVSSLKSKSGPEEKKSLSCESSRFKDAESISINFNKTNQKEDKIDDELSTQMFEEAKEEKYLQLEEEIDDFADSDDIIFQYL